ncbi:hypothetical protein GCM10027051_30260 [Niabella terrae]
MFPLKNSLKDSWRSKLKINDFLGSISIANKIGLETGFPKSFICSANGTTLKLKTQGHGHFNKLAAIMDYDVAYSGRLLPDHPISFLQKGIKRGT